MPLPMEKHYTLADALTWDEQERIEQLALIASDSTSEHALSAAQELFIKAQENR